MNIKQDKLTKIAIIFLMVLLLFLTVKFLKISNQFENQIQESKLEIKILESQLDEILHKYDSVHVESTISKDLLLLNQDIQALNENALINKELNFSENKPNSKEKITLVINRPKKKEGLKAVNIKVKGVKIISDVFKNNRSQIQQLHVCYTLLSNSYIKQGTKKIYIQAIDPKNQIINNASVLLSENATSAFAYSAVSELFYANQDIDACVYLNLNKNSAIKGEYIVNIYCDSLKIGTSIFDYR